MKGLKTVVDVHRNAKNPFLPVNQNQSQHAESKHGLNDFSVIPIAYIIYNPI